MLYAYRNSATEVVHFLRGHPRTAPVLLSLAGAGVLGKILLYLWRTCQANKKRQARQAKARARTKQVENRVAEITDSDKIVKKPIQELREALRNGSLSLLQVLHAFQKQALKASERINCVVECIPEAEEWAKALEASPRFKGLLHGIPVSLKENMGITGYDMTAGMQFFIGKDELQDSVVVQVLKNHGAIPYVRTNIPQTMLSYDCHNPLYGTTLNPLDNKRTPGGSSTGEGALIGAGGSVMGVGNDIGGSLRIPAEFCGIYALKPTWTRISRKGMMTLSNGHLTVRAVPGPMARDFDSLLLLTQAFLSPPMFELDPLLPNLPFDKQEYEKTSSMRIGFYTYDGTFQCQPPNVRAVMEAKAALESMGHEIVHFDFPTIMGEGFQGTKYLAHVLAADRLSKLRKYMANDKVVSGIGMHLRLGQLPTWLLKAARFLIGWKDHMLAGILAAGVGFRNIEEYLERIEDLEDFRDRFLQAWQSMDLDAVICPVFPSPAPTRDLVGLVTPAGIYCWLYNSVNYPSGVVPVTKVTQADLEKTFDPKHFQAKTMYEKLLLKSSQGSEGMSVGVQCVSLPFREEVCLRVMRDLTKALGKA